MSSATINDLIDAVKHDNLELLIDLHLDILNLSDSDQNETLLHTAVRSMNSEAVEYLLKNGANPNLKNVDYNTAFDLLGRYITPEILESMSNYGFDPNSYNSSGLTFCQNLVVNNNIDQFLMIYIKISDLNIESREGLKLSYYILKYLDPKTMSQSQLKQIIELFESDILAISPLNLSKISFKRGLSNISYYAKKSKSRYFHDLLVEICSKYFGELKGIRELGGKYTNRRGNMRITGGYANGRE